MKKTNIINLTFLIMFIFGYRDLFALSVFLKNGSIIEGSIIERTAKEIILKNEKVDRLTIEKEKIKRIHKTEEYKKKYRMYNSDGSHMDVYIVDQNRRVYVVRDELNDSREFTIAKRNVVRKVPVGEKETKSSDNNIDEIILVGKGLTWDSFYLGIGGGYAVAPGLLGKNFKDGFGPSLKLFNSPGNPFFWGFGISGIYFRTNEKTQLLEVGNMLLNFDAILGYTMNLKSRRVSLTFYGGAGYSLFMLGLYGDQHFNSGGASIDEDIFDSRLYHCPAVITGIQIPVRVFRRTNVMPFIEHRWLPVSKTYLGMINMGMTFNW